jgi:hypothetical protein
MVVSYTRTTMMPANETDLEFGLFASMRTRENRRAALDSSPGAKDELAA